jgi:hypothetical protein
MQCLEKKAADRPQTAEEVLRQLDQVLTPSGGMTPTDTRPYQTAGMRRARQRQLMMGAAVVAGLAVSGVLSWRWWQSRGIPIVADRVVIAPFRNETGKPELADLGWRLAEQIGGMVSREGVTEPVSTARVRDLLGGDAAPTSGALERLGKQAGAGLVVRGNYRSRGDSVEVRAEILRMPASTRLYDLAPVFGAATDADLLDRVAEQVTLALQLNKDWGDDYRWGQDYRMPASLAAYREYVKAQELAWKGSWDESGTVMQQALALDSIWPVLRIDRISRLSGSEQDTMLARERATATGYLPGNQDDLEILAAGLDWAREREYQALKRRYLRSPAEYRGDFIWAAYTTRRWHEAVQAGAGRDMPTFYSRRTGDHPGPWAAHLGLIYTFHALGQHDSVLQLAREMRGEGERYLVWAITGEIISHAALHHADVVDSLVAEAGALSFEPGSGPAYRRDAVAWWELAAHGNPDAARRTAGRYAEQLLAEARGTGPAQSMQVKMDLRSALRYAGRAAEAMAMEPALVEALGPESPGGLGLRGRIAIRSGNRDSAYAIVERLRALSKERAQRGASVEALGLLCALADTARAIAQFQETWRLGDADLHYDWIWHRSGFDCIKNQPAILAVMRPKD